MTLRAHTCVVLLSIVCLFSSGCSGVLGLIEIGARIGVAAAEDAKRQADSDKKYKAQQAQARAEALRMRAEAMANPCQPSCEGKACGGDGCGGDCGICERIGVTQSGIVHERTQVGLGKTYPHKHGSVVVRYERKRVTNGVITQQFSTGKSISVPLSRFRKGLKEAIQLMVKAEKRRFVIPAHLIDEAPTEVAITDDAYVYDVTLFAFKPPY